jgi:hypothetical protein
VPFQVDPMLIPMFGRGNLSKKFAAGGGVKSGVTSKPIDAVRTKNYAFGGGVSQLDQPKIEELTRGSDIDDFMRSMGIDPKGNISPEQLDRFNREYNDFLQKRRQKEETYDYEFKEHDAILANSPPYDPRRSMMQERMLQMARGGKALSAVKKGVETAKKEVKARAPKIKQTVKDPERLAFPGIYKRPDEIAAEAASRVAPESPALKRLFGVTRQDLADIARSRKGNLPGILPGAAANPKGSLAAERIMTPRNTQRILDAMAEAEKYPELVTGMDPWYVMDPLYQMMLKELGPDLAKQEYIKMNTLMGMASPGSEVTTEIPRGTAAYYLQKQGRFPEFEALLGKPASQRGPDFPEDIRSVPGHMYHSTAQAIPMKRYLESGEMEMTTPKVPLYIQASGVPEVGFQTRTPVGDAHWSRATGLADTRGGKSFAGSVTNPEMTQLAPWWRSKIAEELGIEPVSAQARAWGTFAPQTGVTTPIGSPKLELLADQAVLAGRRMGIEPEEALRMFIMGEGRLGKKKGGAVRKGALAAVLS